METSGITAEQQNDSVPSSKVASTLGSRDAILHFFSLVRSKSIEEAREEFDAYVKEFKNDMKFWHHLGFGLQSEKLVGMDSEQLKSEARGLIAKFGTDHPDLKWFLEQSV